MLSRQQASHSATQYTDTLLKRTCSCWLSTRPFARTAHDITPAGLPTICASKAASMAVDSLRHELLDSGGGGDGDVKELLIYLPEGFAGPRWAALSSCWCPMTSVITMIPTAGLVPAISGARMRCEWHGLRVAHLRCATACRAHAVVIVS